MTKHPALDYDFPVIVEEFKAGKIDRARAIRELVYIGLAVEEAGAALDGPAMAVPAGAPGVEFDSMFSAG